LDFSPTGYEEWSDEKVEYGIMDKWKVAVP
jgi:hypothetical protein